MEVDGPATTTADSLSTTAGATDSQLKDKAVRELNSLNHVLYTLIPLPNSPCSSSSPSVLCYCDMQAHAGAAMSGAALLLKGSIIPDVAEPEVRVASSQIQQLSRAAKRAGRRQQQISCPATLCLPAVLEPGGRLARSALSSVR